ncbi:MAG: DUF1844 domain-containing protein [Deltaproteobacteria bacterium]|jgi:hypothetical protein|nr:DUF1844 domain-containing protein [Deltaproteobacteria bacterium]
MTEFEVNDRRLVPKDGVLAAEEKKDSSGSGPSPETGTRREEPGSPPPPQPRDEAASAAGSSAAEAAGTREKKAEASVRPEPEPETEPEASFSSLVIGFGTTALIHMGESAPGDPQPPTRDLKAAKHFIDILGVLEKKTRGNLTEEEFQLLKAFLYDLRLKFVKLSSENQRNN